MAKAKKTKTSAKSSAATGKKKAVKKAASSAVRRKAGVKKAKKAVSKKVKAAEKKVAAKPEKYWEATGRRKTALARVRLFTKGEKTFLINNKPLNVYFPTVEMQQIAQLALDKMKCLDKFGVSAKVKGGGLHAQAEAVRHGTARALTLFNSDFRKRLKKSGFLTRDPRMRERKKFGLKRARRAPQWAKR